MLNKLKAFFKKPVSKKPWNPDREVTITVSGARGVGKSTIIMLINEALAKRNITSRMLYSTDGSPYLFDNSYVEPVLKADQALFNCSVIIVEQLN